MGDSQTDRMQEIDLQISGIYENADRLDRATDDERPPQEIRNIISSIRAKAKLVKELYEDYYYIRES